MIELMMGVELEKKDATYIVNGNHCWQRDPAQECSITGLLQGIGAWVFSHNFGDVF
jgi:hypothetical protein